VACGGRVLARSKRSGDDRRDYSKTDQWALHVRVCLLVECW